MSSLVRHEMIEFLPMFAATNENGLNLPFNVPCEFVCVCGGGGGGVGCVKTKSTRKYSID